MALTEAQKQAAYKKRQEDKGLVRVRIWIPDNKQARAATKALEKNLQNKHTGE